ncbi:MAG: alpha-amylase/4-alpha-glucanotransferase domain-containing protein, partial [Myxococcota bacterium]
MTMEPIQLQLVIPFHQPLSVGSDELAEACERFYEPFVARVEAHEGLQLTLHFGGHLLDYLSRNREDLLMRLRALYQAGRIEILSGLFYGGIPALLPEEDVRGQLQMGSEYWESLLGEAPTGVWFPELAWTSEIPRFLSESEALYGFGSSSQFQRGEYPTRGLGVLERSGHKLATYLLDDTLSRSIVGSDVDRWVDSVVDRASGLPRPVISVWVRGERLGFEPGSHAWAFERGWLDSFMKALGGGRSEIQSVRPVDSFDSVRPVTAVKLNHGCADVVEPDAGSVASVDWYDFLQNFQEVDTLARRMLRASDKLRETVTLMEEESLEAEWSGQLATAQRLLFSAQAPDAYWRGRGAGFSDPLVRSATYARLIEAEQMIDTLVQGPDDFIAEEEDDRDGDLLDEVIIATRYLTAWLDPNQGGRLRTLDDRIGVQTLLDVPPRRSETFFHRASEAPFASAVELEARGPRGPLDPLPRREHELVLETDRSARCGLRDWILDDGTSAAELFSGSALDLTPEFPVWELLRSEIDDEGDLSFHLETQAELPLAGVSRRTLSVRRGVHIPIDQPEVAIDAQISGVDGERLLYATEFPIRITEPALWVDEQPHEPSQSEFHGAREVAVRSEDGTTVRLRFYRPVDVWADRIRTTLKDVDGFR